MLSIAYKGNLRNRKTKKIADCLTKFQIPALSIASIYFITIKSRFQRPEEHLKIMF